ncbi:ABC transporter permease [Bartonella krasnovii]|uniref:ABC transporter permease n=1 Tax=Bartonella krasnovii TaxID=2267275 RepID=A0A5B9D1M4_9HYPH|nr:ABC-2 family transporter protein [Bartonella krasnovii]QEE12368.1 ABC transporter permease [Bartonella krasnovii]UNF41558.1 ABC transporter permease [Bartonella krasnovii]UNF43212.1 ABC transporter permease [Bartonella krasnovii]UNF53064.1 ABC transporter permease [Bartonella krasnovii]UNF54762.1 ABC transporter permease [Bartonella krasnovii]
MEQGDEMKIILYFIGMNMRRQLVYGKNFIGEFILSLCYYFIQFTFIDRISCFSGNIGSYSRDEIHFIFVVFILLGIFLNIFTSSIETFFEKVAEGKIEGYLTKPVSIWLLILLGWCRPLYLIKFSIVGVSAYSFVSLPDMSEIKLKWFSFIIAIGCAFIVNMCFFMMFNFITFMTNRKMPVAYFHAMLYQLSFIPIAIYPLNLVKWLLFLLPLAFSASLPVSFLFGKNEWNIGYLLLSTFLSIAMTFMVYKKTMRKFNGLGG